jgi:hypothetical protein
MVQLNEFLGQDRFNNEFSFAEFNKATQQKGITAKWYESECLLFLWSRIENKHEIFHSSSKKEACELAFRLSELLKRDIIVKKIKNAQDTLNIRRNKKNLTYYYGETVQDDETRLFMITLYVNFLDFYGTENSYEFEGYGRSKQLARENAADICLQFEQAYLKRGACYVPHVMQVFNNLDIDNSLEDF